MAISSPLLESSIDGARGVLLSIAAGSDLLLHEVSTAANLIQESAAEDANIIWGTVIDDALGDEVRVTVIAAGFAATPSRRTSSRPTFTRPQTEATEPTLSTPAAEVPPREPVIRSRRRSDDDGAIELPDFFS